MLPNALQCPGQPHPTVNYQTHDVSSCDPLDMVKAKRSQLQAPGQYMSPDTEKAGARQMLQMPDK